MTGFEEAAAVASLAATAIGTATSIVGGMAQAKAASEQAAYAAQVARNNEITANQNAVAAVQAGQATAERKGLEERGRLAMITAAQAASGEDVNSGSAVDVRQSQREVGLTDRATEEHNAFMTAYGFETQGVGYAAQAELDATAARNATALAPIQAVATGLQGASALGSKWNQFTQSGAFGSKASGGNFGPDETYT